ncbi:MAG: MgtC/SapB family protein [Erysipelotrichaceae bacterium]|jgi:putative Mg2+ transporter-C (MgtC) family protein|nr:MgtC/SapB family protein [Erysipelotrichaceae bacterium]
MITIFNAVRGIDFLSVLVKMICAFILGGLIGLERSYNHKNAGFRTHILVCIGACVASLTGLFLYLGLKVPTDMSRIGAQVVTGLGFIGAGTIVVTRKKTVKGLTTAAGLWTDGVIGIAVGAGFYEGAILSVFLVLLAETYFANIKAHMHRSPEFKLVVSYFKKDNLDDVLRYCKDRSLAITNLQITGTNENNISMYSGMITLRPDQPVNQKELVEHINSMNGIVSAETI